MTATAEPTIISLATGHARDWTFAAIDAAIERMARMEPADQLADFWEAFPGQPVPRSSKQAREHAARILKNRLGSFQRCQTIGAV